LRGIAAWVVVFHFSVSRSLFQRIKAFINQGLSDGGFVFILSGLSSIMFIKANPASQPVLSPVHSSGLPEYTRFTLLPCC
jgi:hypothetical protein